MIALAQTIEREVAVPGWVPPEFRAIYRLVATTRSEEDAAALARKLKAADGESGWTGGRLAILVSMWADGRSAAQISDAIGGGITRAAVIGKLHRLHLAEDMRDRPKRAVAPKARLVVVPKVVDKPVPKPPVSKPIAPAVAYVAPPEPAPEGGVGFVELRAHHCRWMFGTGIEARFCDATRVPDARRWFCEKHQTAAADQTQHRKSKAPAS